MNEDILKPIFEKFAERKNEQYDKDKPFHYEKFTGLICPTFTALTGDSMELDLSQVEQYANDLVKQECSSIYLTGTSGQSVSLTHQERKECLKAWMNTQAVKTGKLRTMAHIGCDSIVSMIDQAKFSHELGCDAIAAFPPSYYKPKNAKECAEFMIKLAHEVPTMPVYFYYFPANNGITVSVAETLTIANQYAPNVVGTKFTDQKVSDLERCATLGFNAITGHDETFAYALAAGADGQIGMTNNFSGNEHAELFRSYKRGDTQRANQLSKKRNEIIQKLIQTGNPLCAGVYMTEKLRGLKFGMMRYPLYNLDDKGMAIIDKFIENFDFNCS